MKKIAIIFEWIGVAVILVGVAYFGFMFFRKSILTPIERAALLWIVGGGTLCYAPMGYVRFVQARQKAQETNDEIDKKNCNIKKRLLALRIIFGIVLIGNGFLTLWKAMQATNSFLD